MQCRCVQSLRKILTCRRDMYCNGRIGMALHWTSSIFWTLLPQKMPAHRRIPRDYSHPQKLHPGSRCRISRAHTQVSSIACRSLTRARKPAHTHRRMLLSTANLQAVYLRGHGCWLVIVDRHGRGLKATFQVRPGVDTNSKCLPSAETSVRRTFRFDNLPWVQTTPN